MYSDPCRHLIAVFMAGAAAVLLSAALVVPLHAAPGTPTPPAPRAPALLDKRAAAGQQVYLKNYCGVCHTLAAANTRGAFGPPHNHIATTAKQRLADPNYGGQAKTVVQYLRESIVAPSAYTAPGFAYTSHPMPSYAYLPKTDVDALVYFLAQQK